MKDVCMLQAVSTTYTRLDPGSRILSLNHVSRLTQQNNIRFARSEVNAALYRISIHEQLEHKRAIHSK
jgi:hypothetical protein